MSGYTLSGSGFTSRGHILDGRTGVWGTSDTRHVPNDAPPLAHTNLDEKPGALTIEALPHGGYLVKRGYEPYRDMGGLPLVAFTALSDAVTWMKNQMALPKAEPESPGKRR